MHCPLGALEHPDGGAEPAFRVYPDHGWCFACQRYFSPVSLLAVAWELDREDAAAEALRRYGWKPASYAHLWEEAQREPLPDREALAGALTAWCASQCADWRQRQYDQLVSGQLARCLSLLPLVRTRDDCGIWLEACKKAMAHYLS